MIANTDVFEIDELSSLAASELSNGLTVVDMSICNGCAVGGVVPGWCVGWNVVGT